MPMTAPSGDWNRATVRPHGSRACFVQQLVASLPELPRRWVDTSGVGDIELDADLRHRPLCGPDMVGVPKHAPSGLGERPDPDRVTAGDSLAVAIAVTLALERGDPARRHTVRGWRIGSGAITATVAMNSMFTPPPRCVLLVNDPSTFRNPRNSGARFGGPRLPRPNETRSSA